MRAAIHSAAWRSPSEAEGRSMLASSFTTLASSSASQGGAVKLGASSGALAAILRRYSNSAMMGDGMARV